MQAPYMSVQIAFPSEYSITFKTFISESIVSKIYMPFKVTLSTADMFTHFACVGYAQMFLFNVSLQVAFVSTFVIAACAAVLQTFMNILFVLSQMGSSRGLIITLVTLQSFM